MNYILHGNDISRIKQKLANLKTSGHIENTVTFDALSDEQSSVLSEMDSFSIFDENKTENIIFSTTIIFTICCKSIVNML